ncbi:glycosyltransferase family 4 protein [Mesorhizobium sp. KR9-304]
MKSLLIAPTMPDDAGNGLAMRVGVFLEALSSLGELDVILLPMFGTAEAESALCRRLGVRPHIVPVVGRAETHFSIVASMADPQARAEAFIRYGKPSLSAFLSVPVLREIQVLTAERGFDLVHLARSYLLPAAGIWSPGQKPTVSVDLDEDDAETHRRIGALHARRGDDFRAKWLEAEARAFDRLIEIWLPRTDLSFIATERERDAIAERYRVRPLIAGNTVAIPPAASREPPDRTLLFVGGFGYFPNLDAACWLLEEVFPQLINRCGTAVSMTLVGRNPSRRLLALAEQTGVQLLQDVTDLAPLYARASIALVPIRAGGGSRIKLLEAAAYRVPIVATSAGAENSGLDDGSEIWVADTAEAIVEACVAIWAEPAEAMRRSAAAREIVVARHSRPAMVSALRSYFASHLSGAGAQP